MKSISLIIPIYNAEVFLKDLFKCLDNNKFYNGDEILLVDNGSSDESIRLCKDYECKHNGLVKCLSYAEKAGSYSARNYAIKQAIGDILVFTDSDCQPSKDWITYIREKCNKGLVLAGNITLEIVNHDIWEYYDVYSCLNNEKSIQNSGIATANMAVNKEDFDKIGLFEERFSGGDYDWSLRAAKGGLKLEYCDLMRVKHPTRKSFEAVLKKEQRIAYGEGYHACINNHSKILLWGKYILKIFKIDMNIKYMNRLKSEGFSLRDRLRFNYYFFVIRINHLKYVLLGFENIDARSLGLK